MDWLYYLIVKRVDNLALDVFRHYYDELCQALRSSLKEVATVLCSKILVTRQERDQAMDSRGLTPLRKAEILMQAVERRIVTANNATPLRKFCRVLHSHHGVGNIVSRMKLRLGY